MTVHIISTLTIKISERSGTYYIEASGLETKVRHLPFVWSPAQDDLRTLDLLQSAPTKVSEERLVALGQTLYRSVFVPKILSAYDQTNKKLKKGEGIRIRLIVEAVSLSRIPWEIIHNGEAFISLYSEYPIVRGMREAFSVRQAPVRGPIKILYAWSNPEDLPGLNLGGPAEEIKKLVGENKRIKIDILPNATLIGLRKSLVSEYHIICFAGHGTEKHIYLERGSQRKQHEELSAKALALELEGKPVQLVFLVACETARNPSDDLPGFAQTLSNETQVPAVVAMQYEISDNEANLLAARYFELIANFLPLDAALSEARKAVFKEHKVLRDVFAPVMYLQSKTSSLFQRERNWLAIGIAVFAIIATTILAIWLGGTAQTEANARATAQIQADEQSNIALSRKIASAALTETGEVDVKLLLCAQAFQLSPTTEAKKCISELLDKASHVVAIRHNHQNKINDLGVNISRGLLASASDDGSVLIWDIKTWKVIQKLETNRTSVASIEFSPDGNILVSGDKKGILYFWDTVTYELKSSLDLGPAEISSLAFQDNNEILAVGTGDTWAYDHIGEIILIDTKTNQVIARNSQGVAVTDLVYNPKNQDLVFSLQSSSKVYSLNNSGEMSILFQAYDWNTILSLAFSPDGNTLVTGSEIPGSASQGGYLVIWDTNNKKAYWNLEDYSVSDPFLAIGDNVKDVVISNNNQYIINTGGSGIVILENTKDLQKLKNYRFRSIETTAQTESLVILPDNNTVVSGMNDGKLVVWSINPLDKQIKELLTVEQQAVQSFISQVAFSPDTGNLVAFGDSSGFTYWDVGSNSQIMDDIIDTPKDSDGTWDSDGTLSPDGKLYAFSPSRNHEIIVFDIEAKEKYLIPSIQNPRLTFANSTTLLAYKDNDVQICNVVQRQCEMITNNSGEVRRARLSSGGAFLVLGLSDGSIVVWDMKSNKMLTSFAGNWSISDLLFTPDEKVLVWGDKSVIKILNVESKSISELKVHSDIVEKLAISPDGQYLASSAFRDRVILWDIASQTIIDEMAVNPYWVGAMAFNPTSNRLAIPLTMAPKFGGFSSLLIWDVQAFATPTKICEIVGRNLTEQEWQQYFPNKPYQSTCSKIDDLSSVTSNAVFPSPSIAASPLSTSLPSALLLQSSTSVVPSATALSLAVLPSISLVTDSIEYTDIKGVSMRLIPAGVFIMGNNASELLGECEKFYDQCSPLWFKDEEPLRIVDLQAYYMDTYEVTNALFRSCVNAGVCDFPVSSGSEKYDNPEFDDYPFIANWYQAQDYCEWRGARLPTESEWEKAARGVDGRIYPWGNGVPSPNLANYNKSDIHDITKVGSYESGKSPYGIYDMAGNVSEWVSDWYDVYPGGNPEGASASEFGQKFRVLRGGSWFAGENFLRASDRVWSYPENAYNEFGFRCARDANP